MQPANIKKTLAPRFPLCIIVSLMHVSYCRMTVCDLRVWIGEVREDKETNKCVAGLSEEDPGTGLVSEPGG